MGTGRTSKVGDNEALALLTGLFLGRAFVTSVSLEQSVSTFKSHVLHVDAYVLVSENFECTDAVALLLLSDLMNLLNISFNVSHSRI